MKNFNQIYLINHQNCGVISRYLSCSGYPATLGANNSKEIQINRNILTFANNYVLRKICGVTCILALIDVNGSVASLNIVTGLWTVIYVGEGDNTLGLWYGLSINQTYTST